MGNLRARGFPNARVGKHIIERLIKILDPEAQPDHKRGAAAARQPHYATKSLFHPLRRKGIPIHPKILFRLNIQDFGSGQRASGWGKCLTVSGGFGVEERENLRAMSKDDNLELSFALQNKDYLGGAKVLIKDGNGKDVLKTFSDGPLFFAKLPQGTCAVEATSLGQAQEQIVHSNTTQIQQATKPHSPHIVAPLIA